MLLFVICYLPVAIIFIIMGIFQLRRMRAEAHLTAEIARSGSPIRGTILDHIVRTQGRRSFYAISYQYQRNDQLYDGEQEVSREHYALLTEGEDIDLCYLEQKPAIAILAGEDRAVILGSLASKLKRTGKIIKTDFAIVLTVANGEIVRFQMLEGSFAVSQPAHG